MLGDGVECSAQSVNCKQCSDNLCNGEVFPSNRISCYQCQGNSSDVCYTNLETNTELSYPCENFNFRDSCYTYISKDNMVFRGCLSDQVESMEKCLSDPIRCQSCQTSSCNSESVMKAPDLSCVTVRTLKYNNDLLIIWHF